MIAGDMAYKAFRAWLEEYAKTVADKFASAAERTPRKSRIMPPRRNLPTRAE
jgi:hypothetical protein